MGDGRKLNPDIFTYLELERLEMLQIATIRHDNILIGYHLSIIRPHLHHKDVLAGFEDSSFITKRYRFSRIPVKLITFAENELRIRGVKEIFLTVRSIAGSGRLIQSRGYIEQSKIYSKRI